MPLRMSSSHISVHPWEISGTARRPGHGTAVAPAGSAASVRRSGTQRPGEDRDRALASRCSRCSSRARFTITGQFVHIGSPYTHRTLMTAYCGLGTRRRGPPTLSAGPPGEIGSDAAKRPPHGLEVAEFRYAWADSSGRTRTASRHRTAAPGRTCHAVMYTCPAYRSAMKAFLLARRWSRRWAEPKGVVGDLQWPRRCRRPGRARRPGRTPLSSAHVLVMSAITVGG